MLLDFKSSSLIIDEYFKELEVMKTLEFIQKYQVL